MCKNKLLHATALPNLYYHSAFIMRKTIHVILMYCIKCLTNILVFKFHLSNLPISVCKRDQLSVFVHI